MAKHPETQQPPPQQPKPPAPPPPPAAAKPSETSPTPYPDKPLEHDEGGPTGAIRERLNAEIEAGKAAVKAAEAEHERNRKAREKKAAEDDKA